MRTKSLIAGLALIFTTVGAAGYVWQNKLTDDDMGNLAGTEIPVPDPTSGKSADLKATPSTAVDKTLSSAPDENTGRETKMAALDPKIQIENLLATAPAKPSVADTDPRVSVSLNKIDPNAPRLDVVRIDASGMAIIAGRGLPGSSVDILVGKKVIGTARVEGSGSFATVLQTPVLVGVQKISLRSFIGSEEIKGPEEVTIVLPESTKQEKPLIVVSQPDQPSRIVQRPATSGLGGEFGLDVIDYDEKGRVVLSGSASGNTWVHVLLDSTSLGKTQATNEGHWSLTALVNVSPGRYIIHLEERDEKSQILRQADFPFERAELNQLVIADGEMIVQPGHNLWNIAKANYGSGVQYRVIYAANAGKISNPDLIFPGQVLNLPSN